MSALLLLVSAATAATWTVRSDGSGDFTTVPAAVAAAASGDRIEVPAGDWDGPVDFSGKNLSLVGVDGAASTTLSGGGAAAVLRFSGGESGEAQVTGFTLVEAERAVYISDGSPTLSELVISGFGESASYGGAVWVGGGRPVFEQVWFSDNSALYGGAVYVVGGVPRFVDCTFEANGDPDYGSTGAWGGAIYAAYTDVELENNLFDGNFAQYGAHVGMWSGGKLSSDGDLYANGIATYGGVALHTSTWGEFEGATFEGNAAYYQGGGIYVYDTDRLSTTSCVFTENSVYSSGGGGAIYAYDPGELRVEDTAFVDNIATYTYAAAIWTAYPRMVDIIDSEFAGQRSYYAGGAIYAYVLYGATRVVDSTFTDNATTHGTGGALHLDYGTDTVSVSGTAFERNRAGTHGGGLYVNDLEVDIIDVGFLRNTAGQSGGGLRVDNTRGTRKSALLARVDADHNTADGDGGGLSLANLPSLELVDVSASHNDSGGAGGGLHAVDIGTLAVRRLRAVDNQADYGGGLYIADVGAAPPDGEASALALRNLVLQQNAARYGGGACLLQSVDAVVRQATIVGNAATEQGSGLCAYSQALDLQNTVFAWNTGSAALEALDEASATGFSGLYNAWYANTADSAGGIEGAPGGTDLSEPPRFANSALDADFPDPWTLAADSPLRDAGNPAQLDPDGSPADIGAMGGADTWQGDGDGDGTEAWQDCDDSDASVHPGAADAWYDGIDANCDGMDDQDADGDGVPVDSDCDDTDPARSDDCSEAGDDTAVDPDLGDDTGDTEASPEADPTAGTSGDKGGCTTASGVGGLAWVLALGLAARRRR